jgi:hypothetical protein
MFFLRRYVKGNHQSGTINVAEWEERPSIIEFIAECDSHGEGKFVLFERGVGIRGMRKINEYSIKTAENVVSHREDPIDYGNTVRSKENLEPSIAEMVVFAAEEMGLDSEAILSVKQNKKVSDLSDEELVKVLEQAIDSDVSSAEGFTDFKGDLKALMGEFRKRNTDMSLQAESSSKKGSNGVAIGGAFLAGGLVGVLATGTYYKGKLSDLEERLMSMETSVQETETMLEKQSEDMAKQKRAEEAVRQFDTRIGLDSRFLSTFNSENGPQNL